ncbi:MAG: PTS transporter subunit IIC [Eubacterium ventriosum]
MNWILGKIGFDKIKINATTLQKKLGIFGEPMFIGLVVGALIGFLGNINDLTTVAGWGSIITAEQFQQRLLWQYSQELRVSLQVPLQLSQMLTNQKRLKKEKIETGTYQLTMQ